LFRTDLQPSPVPLRHGTAFATCVHRSGARCDDHSARRFEDAAQRERERERERTNPSTSASRARKRGLADHGGKARAGRPVGVPSDLSLLARAALTGSNEDRDTFLKACWRYAYAAAKRLGRRHDGAEDGAQDAVLVVRALLEAKPPALAPDSIAGFVSVVVLRNVRLAARRRAREASAAGQTAPARRAPDPALGAETAEWARRVRAAVATLQQPLRRLVELRYWDELSTREIAREVARSQRSVIRLLKDAEILVKSRLRRHDDDRSDTSPATRP
jgi:RNA polymerase sigma factor (sigma-70 family)